VKPRRVDAATRMSLALLSRLSRLFEWRSALVVVRPETLIRWHRAGFRLFGRWKSRPGRPPIPLELRQLIRRMARENTLWGQERIANELWVKLGLRVSPRTIRKYLPRAPAGCPRGDQRWSTFLKNHAQAIVACDFFVAVTCGLRLLYVFVVMEHRSRRLIHCNVTAHPSALWTRQQLREALGYETRYRYLIHDRDNILSLELDGSVGNLALCVLKTPPRSPMANGICERMIGTIRRECLDGLIPLSEAHLRRILKLWVAHYNRGRPPWCSDLACRTRRLPHRNQCRSLAIDLMTSAPCAVKRCSVGCITSTPSLPHERGQRDRSFCGAQRHNYSERARTPLDSCAAHSRRVGRCLP